MYDRKLLSLTLIIALAHCTPLITDGPWILNSTNRQRVQLKCANWYGAHQELHVVGGLELRSVSHLTDLFQASGANCVRLPFSVEMVKYNPVVKRKAIAGIQPTDGCNSTRRALDVLDCVVSHLQRRGILLIFNSHNSHGTWVGAGAPKHDQGLWNLPGYSTEDWIQSMERIAGRYKIAGMDLRNEIHDQDGVKITWGESDNIDTDWLAASTAAYDRLYRIDPDILAIVGGLCWNTDIRAMMGNVGPVKALRNKKLVYTVHIYTFSFWWNNQSVLTDVVTPLSICLFVFFSLLAASIFIRCPSPSRGEYKQLSRHPWGNHEAWWAFFASSAIFDAGWLAIAAFYYNTAVAAGCSSFANDSVWLIALASTAMVLAVSAGLCYWRAFPTMLTLAFGFVWAALYFLGIFIVGAYLSSDASYTDALDHTWLLKEDRPVPVWVGEFGTGTPDDPTFKLIWEFIHARHNLDFAYWAFNGRKWRDRDWESESFGLTDDKYSDWRFPALMQALYPA